MKNLIKLYVILLAFIIIFSTNSIAGEIILPLKKPTVDKEVKAKTQSKKTIYPAKKPIKEENKNLTDLQENDVVKKLNEDEIVPIYPKKKPNVVIKKIDMRTCFLRQN